MSHLKSINNYLIALSTPRFIVLITIMSYIVFIPFLPLVHLYIEKIGPMGESSSIKEMSPVGVFVAVVIFAPLIETLLLQAIPIKVMSLIPVLKSRKFIIILLSAALFASTHSYSLLYIAYTFIIGILLAYSYCVYESKNISAFKVVVIIHALRNGISFVIRYFVL